MTEQTRTCATCTENDGGLCDLKGVLIEDDDTCERWSNKQADWREHILNTFLAGHQDQRTKINIQWRSKEDDI